MTGRARARHISKQTPRERTTHGIDSAGDWTTLKTGKLNNSPEALYQDGSGERYADGKGPTALGGSVTRSHSAVCP
jgi:hypothetical protein